MGDLKSWRSGIRDDVFQDPNGSTSYAYEFCNREMPLWTGVKTTWAEYKHRTIERMGTLGESAVPIVRCFAHVPILNLAFNGRIDTNSASENWEDQYPQFTHEDLHPETLFFHEPLRTTLRLFPSRAADTDARQLDLTKYYNAYLEEPWLPFPPGSDLKSLRQGSQEFGGTRFDVRGLIQLNGARLLAPIPSSLAASASAVRARRFALTHATRSVPVHDRRSSRTAQRSRLASCITERRAGRNSILYGRAVKDWWRFGLARPRTRHGRLGRGKRQVHRCATRDTAVPHVLAKSVGETTN